MHQGFDMFTERARKVLSLAQDEAHRLNHNYIGTEHLLLGLVREADGVAAKVLQRQGVELNTLRSSIEFIVGRGDRIVLGEIGLTPRSKAVIELAVDEALRLNHRYIGTEHLLLGLLREGEGIGVGSLESLGVSVERLRAETLRVLGQSGSPHNASPPTSATRQEGDFTYAPLSNARAASMQIDGLNEDTQHVLALAQLEAHYLHVDAIGDEHILLGLVLEGRSYAAQALDQHGATILAVRRALDGVADASASSNMTGVTSLAHEIVMRAKNEAARLGERSVGPAHVLLALLRSTESVAVAALRQLDIDPIALADEVSRGLRGDSQTNQ